ncbi:protein kinase [Catenuloplanes sp. NPDC051500]|uniref:protein kinase domain-containing protein n=1 Tax=Catenuloplanes sp. NPDC051500 TaxID=3363959 RepID=UPI003794DFBB
MPHDDGFYVGPEASPNKYRLLDCLGAGGEGEVWTADLTLSPLGRLRVAVKILRDDLIGRDDASWERHADLLRSVSHPGLVRVVEVFTGARKHRLGDALPAGRNRYVVMDHIEGDTLRDWLAEHPDSTLTSRLQRLRNVAAALDEMHSGDQTVVPIAHGDVKPGNIVIREDGTTELVDLGLMRISDGTGIRGATAPYAAPELLRSGAPTTPEADRFAFAATVAHVVLGESPPTGDAGPDLKQTSAMLARSPLSARRHMLQQQVMAALEAPPEQRPKSLSRWLSTLTDSLSQVTEQGGEAAAGPATSTHDGVGDGAGSPTGPLWRRRGHLASSAVLALLALAGVCSLVVPDSRESSGALPRCASAGPSASPAVRGSAAAPATGHPDELLIFASQDKTELINDLARAYGPRLAAGQCMTIRAEAHNSGKLRSMLARGWHAQDGPRPDVWSPAASTWVALARHEAKPGILGDQAESMFSSPLVIGMPKPMAEALGWPNTAIGWSELAELARDPRGWGGHGHPEWGPFLLGKTNPRYSASGLAATVGAFLAATGRTDELTEEAVNAESRAEPSVVKDIEKAVVHYGDTTLTFLANLRHADDRKADPPYISAVTLEEASLVAYNRGYPCGAASDEPGCARTDEPTTPLVAIYPREGTLSSDHPFVKMVGLSDAKSAVADDFLAYVRSDAPEVIDRLADVGFRTFDGKRTKNLTAEHGAVPSGAASMLEIPPARVLTRLLEVWPELRKPANVLVVVDTSGSMENKIKDDGTTKLDLVKQAANALVAPEGFGDDDRVGLWQFSEETNGGPAHRVVVPSAPMASRQRDQITNGIAGLRAGGGTALFDTIDAAVAQIRSTWDPNAINAVVVLSDGKDEDSRRIDTVEKLVPKILSEDEPVRVFTIAYGKQAVTDEASRATGRDDGDQDDRNGDLANISNETGAHRYTAPDATTIADVLIDVISNF